jgi:hypothetical protein
MATAPPGAEDPGLTPISPLKGAENGNDAVLANIVLQPASAGL